MWVILLPTPEIDEEESCRPVELSIDEQIDMDIRTIQGNVFILSFICIAYRSFSLPNMSIYLQFFLYIGEGNT